MLNTETKFSYSWPEISKISKDSEVSQQRVASFLGFNFKTDKERKINLKKTIHVSFNRKHTFKDRRNR